MIHILVCTHWTSACSSFLWCWKCTLASFANSWEKENVMLIICTVLALEASGSLVTHHTRNTFQRAHSLMACHCFVWTLHSTVPNPNDKSAGERRKALEEKISQWKIKTLSSAHVPLISQAPGSCYKQNELIIFTSPWGCICTQKLAVKISMTDLYSIKKKYLGRSLNLDCLGSSRIIIGTLRGKLPLTFLQSLKQINKYFF